MSKIKRRRCFSFSIMALHLNLLLNLCFSLLEPLWNIAVFASSTSCSVVSKPHYYLAQPRCPILSLAAFSLKILNQPIEYSRGGLHRTLTGPTPGPSPLLRAARHYALGQYLVCFSAVNCARGMWIRFVKNCYPRFSLSWRHVGSAGAIHRTGELIAVLSVCDFSA